jgi:Predicted redox protein, regulator of disulfide bond formation
MSTTIDTRGFSCPQPVLMFLNAVKADDHGPFCVLVDNDASLENVSRAARNRGFSVETSAEADGVTRLDISKQ